MRGRKDLDTELFHPVGQWGTFLFTKGHVLQLENHFGLMQP